MATIQQNVVRNIDHTDPHLIQYMRTALAVAIIRRTPKDRSPRQYAEQLCTQYRQAQLRWKDKAETLKQEVLHLRQQLLQHKWTEEGLLTKDQDSPSLDAGNSQVFPTPPCSSEDPQDNPILYHTQEELLTRHASFLQSVLTLSTISTHDTAATASDTMATSSGAAPIDSVFEQTAQESIQSALITLGDLLTSTSPQPPTISKKMIFHMVQVIVNLVDSRQFSKYLSDAICDMVLCFAWGVISALQSNMGLSEEFRERLSVLVLLLARSRTLRPPVVQMLTTQLIQVSHHLRGVTSGKVPFDVHLFQNSYHFFRTLEKILEQDILRKDRCLTLRFCQAVHKQLDGSLLHVWEAFPPFAQYTWHIEGLLQYIHPNVIFGESVT